MGPYTKERLIIHVLTKSTPDILYQEKAPLPPPPPKEQEQVNYEPLTIATDVQLGLGLNLYHSLSILQEDIVPGE